MRSIVTRLWNPAVAMIVCVSAGLGGAVAQAQDMPEAMYPGMMERGAMSCRMDEHIDGDLAYLKTVLKISRRHNGMYSPKRSVPIGTKGPASARKQWNKPAR